MPTPSLRAGFHKQHPAIEGGGGVCLPHSFRREGERVGSSDVVIVPRGGGLAAPSSAIDFLADRR